jgi:iron complex outermembrane receptor protein
MRTEFSRSLQIRRVHLLTAALVMGHGGVAWAEAPAPADARVTVAGNEADAPAADDQITVTGRHDPHLDQVQATPASITTLSGEKLDQQGITNVRELGVIVPNLYQTRTAVSYLNTNIFIRGVGEPDAQGEPSVGIYVDGIYVPKNLGAQQELLDIDQIDIYRGPQGQAFGHSAAAGALVINTITPDDTPRLKIQAGYGNYNDARFGIAASGPIGGNFYSGVALSYHRRDGLNRNVTLNRDTNTIDYLAGRTKLRYAPSDRFDITLALSGVRDRSTARGVQNLLFGDRDAHSQVFPANRYDQLAATLTLNYALDDHLRLRSIGGAYGFNQTAFFDNTGDIYGRGSQFVRYRDRTYQEELQLIGAYGRFDFVTGLYAYREEWFTNRRANTAANATNVVADIRYRPVYSLIQQNTDTLAGYAEAHYALTGRLRLTAGLRYNWEKHFNENQLYNLVAAAPFQSNAANFLDVLFAPPQALVWSADVERSWSSWSPKGSIDFKWAPGILQYATISQGTKSAGFDYRAQTPSASGLLQAQLAYDPETVTNYETGLKTEFLNGRLRANLSAFYIRFDDIQITTTDPATTISRRFNAGRGSTRGVEFEGTAIPVKGLQIDANGSYLKARLDKFLGNRSTITTLPDGRTLRSGPFEGAVLPYSPKWQGRLAATWQLPLQTRGVWALQGSVSYQGASYTDTTNNFSVRLPSQTYVDGQFGYTTEGGHWSAVVAVKNIANKHYALPPGYTPASNGAPIYRATNYNDPRTILFTIAYKR